MVCVLRVGEDGRFWSTSASFKNEVRKESGRVQSRLTQNLPIRSIGANTVDHRE
jgi:hypothetical protein